MEVKINREIRDYTESLFFGLSLRQCVFAALACGAAVGLYFLLSPYLGLEMLSWVCISGAVPFAAVGFIRYHSMSAEQFVWAWVRSEVLMQKRLIYEPPNLYLDALENPVRTNRHKRDKNSGIQGEVSSHVKDA
jgi:hypothetical protein